MSRKWTVLKSRELLKIPFMRLRDDELELPDKRIFSHYYVFDFPDWVNVVPVTSDGRLVLIRQYRHAVGEYCIEIPGGSTDPRQKELPEGAARRELIEETGYEPQSLIHIGTQQPNPALISNRLWSYVALGCEKKFEQNLDEFEDIEVMTHTVEETLAMIKDGQIKHSMVIAAIYLALPHLKIKT